MRVIVAFITLNVRNHEIEDHIMRYQRFTAAPAGYAEYPSHGYGYNYPTGGYYAGHPRSYSASYGDRPYYSPEYQRYNDTYERRGGGSN